MKPVFLSRSSTFARLALTAGVLVVAAQGRQAQAPPGDFEVEDVLTNLEQPMAVRFLPDGRLLVLLKQGQVLLVDVSSTPATASFYLDLGSEAHPAGLDGDSERGLLDVAVDPYFPAEPYVYLFYTPANGNARIARFTHAENGGGLNSSGQLESELVLWQDSHGYDSCCHFGGGLSFGPDGNLWLTTGDHFQGSYAASLEHGGGKVVRVTKTGDVPLDNPYVDGNGPNVDSVFAYGLRNPFRSRWDLPSGRFFIGEVGGNTQMTAWEDLHVLGYDSGSGRFVDGDFGTVNDNGIFDGIYYGWPTVEGLAPHTDFPTADIQPIAEPLFAYRHDGGFSSITGGVVYRGNRFPAEYQGAYFYGDSTRDFIRYLRFNPDGTVAPNPNPAPLGQKTPDLTSYPFDLFSIGQVVYLEVGPDDALYYVSFNDNGGSGELGPLPGAVRRYVYDPGNVQPLVQFDASPATGLPPLEVAFTVEATDAELAPLAFTLDFGDGSAPVSQPLPDGSPVTIGHTYTQDGAYTSLLDVTDDIQTVHKSKVIRVGNPPVITQFLSTNSRPEGLADVFRYGDVMTFAAAATDAEDGPLPGESFTWSVSFVRPAASHPALGPETGTTSILFPIPNQGQGFSGPVFYRCFLTVLDSSGLTTSSTLDIFPDKVDIEFSSVPDGIAIQVDGNTARLTPFTLDTLINFDHVITAPQTRCLSGVQFEFAGWSNGPATTQQVFNVPDVDTELSAEYTGVGPCTGPPPDGLVMHLDAMTGLALDGNDVVGWQDETVNGNDLTASGTPQLNFGGFNGQVSVHFDGLGASLGRSGFSALPTGAEDRSVFMVGRYNAVNPNGSGWAGFVYGSPASNGAFGLALTPSGILGVQGWGSADILSNPPTNGVGGLLSQSAVYQSSLLTQYLTGAPIGTSAHAFGTGTSAIRLGEELNGGKNLDMDVAEVLVYDRAVTEEERIEIEEYFENRYQIDTGGGNAPAVRILEPSNGRYIFTSEQPITLEATADDFEDGDLTSSISWSSSLDGPLGTGSGISASLSLGMHQIVALVEDSTSLQSTDEIEVLVTDSVKGLIQTGLVLHLEADQGVVHTAGTIASWLDASPSGNDVFAGGNPQWVEGLSPSGLPALHFDGDDKLERFQAVHGLSGLPTGNANRTMFFVVRYLGSSAWAGAAYGSLAINQAFGLIARHPSGELVLKGYGSADLVSGTPGIGTGWMIHSGQVKNGSGRLFRDGLVIAQWPHVYATGLDRLVIASEIGGLGYVTADVAAVLLYDRAMSDAERESVDSYLTEKYLTVNTAPIVSVLAPKGDQVAALGTPVQFTGVATDKHDGDLTTDIQWVSSLDGVFGSGGSVNAILSLGAHTVTATATDSGSLEGMDSVLVVIDALPEVVVASPTSGSVYPAESSVSFEASATDFEDGGLTAQLSWSSSLDGSIGEGGTFATTSLSAGTHTITASVADSNGLVGTGAISVVIDAFPSVLVKAPAEGSAHALGSSIVFTAMATDLEDGDLTAQLSWSSSLDGAIGEGGTFATSLLSSGAHVITAQVTDSSGSVGQDTLSLTVSGAPEVSIHPPPRRLALVTGHAVSFSAEASDPEDGDLGATIAWSSDLDGSLGTGVTISVPSLSPGRHHITASVIDSVGFTASDQFTLQVANAPRAPR